MYKLKAMLELKKQAENKQRLDLREVHRLKYLMNSSLIEECSIMVEDDSELNDIDTVFGLLNIQETYSDIIEELLDMILEDNERVREELKELEEKLKELEGKLEEEELETQDSKKEAIIYFT